MADNEDASNINNHQQRRASMTQDEERERRASIQAIMKDPNLTAQERRKSIQSLMDGRRRSSFIDRGSQGATGAMASAAAMAAAGFEDSDTDTDSQANGINDSSNSGNKHRLSDLRSSLRSSLKSNGTNGSAMKPNKKRGSLRDSFTMGFSNIRVDRQQQEQDPNALSRKLEKSRPPCGHYQRNCSIVSPCCGLVFGCRICHDDSPELPPPFLMSGGVPPDVASSESIAAAAKGSITMEDVKMGAGETAAASSSSVASASAPQLSHRCASLPPNFAEEESHHNIDRFLIKEVICRECFTRQSSKT